MVARISFLLLLVCLFCSLLGYSNDSAAEPGEFSYVIVNEYPHDPTALLLRDSLGIKGSSMREQEPVVARPCAEWISKPEKLSARLIMEKISSLKILLSFMIEFIS